MKSQNTAQFIVAFVAELIDTPQFQYLFDDLLLITIGYRHNFFAHTVIPQFEDEKVLLFCRSSEHTRFG